MSEKETLFFTKDPQVLVQSSNLSLPWNNTKPWLPHGKTLFSILTENIQSQEMQLVNKFKREKKHALTTGTVSSSHKSWRGYKLMQCWVMWDFHMETWEEICQICWGSETAVYKQNKYCAVGLDSVWTGQFVITRLHCVPKTSRETWPRTDDWLLSVGDTERNRDGQNPFNQLCNQLIRWNHLLLHVFFVQQAYTLTFTRRNSLQCWLSGFVIPVSCQKSTLKHCKMS